MPPTTNLDIVIRVQDQASRAIQQLEGQLQRLQRTASQVSHRAASPVAMTGPGARGSLPSGAVGAYTAGLRTESQVAEQATRSLQGREHSVILTAHR